MAILARGAEPIEIRRGLPGDPTDKQARYLEAAIGGVVVGCLYLPNGNPQPGPKFDYSWPGSSGCIATQRRCCRQAKGFSQAIVQHLAKTIPSRFVAKSGPSNRVGKLFVDYLRNGHGATTAAAFSARARPGMGVSIPVGWEDLPTLKSGSQWNVRTARDHLSFQVSDPWAQYWKTRQGLAEAMKRLGYKRG